MRTLCFVAGLCCAASVAAAQTGSGPSWEINGVRLERDQVERLAADLADRTLEAVEEKLPGLELRDTQQSQMREVYRSVSLGVFHRVVDEVAREELDDQAKQDRVRELVLEGQRESHQRLKPILDPRQFELYSAWEAKQVEAYRSRRWDRRRRRRR